MIHAIGAGLKFMQPKPFLIDYLNNFVKFKALFIAQYNEIRTQLIIVYIKIHSNVFDLVDVNLRVKIPKHCPFQRIEG